MKKNAFNIHWLGFYALLFILSGCSKPYLDSFGPFIQNNSEISFAEVGLPAPIKSPFDGIMIHPVGKVDFKSPQGELYSLTFANTVFNKDIPELGKVFAEIIVEGNRVEKLEIASIGAGGYTSEVHLPEIKINTSTYSSTYRVTIKGFEFVESVEKDVCLDC